MFIYIKTAPTYDIGASYSLSLTSSAEYLHQSLPIRAKMLVLAAIPWVIKLHEVAKFKPLTKALTTLKIYNLGAKVLLFRDIRKKKS